MLMMHLFAWLYWNPPRDLFVLPFFDHPVRIYGVCFVTGLILGYFLFAWMVKLQLLASSVIKERDVASWPTLVKILQCVLDKPDHPAAPLLQKLDKKNRQELLALKCHQEPHPKLKSTILASINNCSIKFTRSSLEELLSGALTTAKQWGYILADQLTWFIVLGTLIGGRLGDVFFYDWPYFKQRPWEIFMVWKGGLASHGGVLGVLIGVYLYKRWMLKSFPEMTFLNLMDLLVVPSGLAACFIRIGNFFNQEILGPESRLPWAIIFGDPMDGSPAVPRHPSQLYEALAYLVIFSVMLFLWKTQFKRRRPGFLSGLFFIMLFSFRFLIEFIKVPQSYLINESFLQMGQYLSIPFILLGIGLITLERKSKNSAMAEERLS